MQLRSREALVLCLDATGMSERQLARQAGLSHATVNHLITGRRTGCTLATAHAIEAALGVGPGTLFDSAPAESGRQVDEPRQQPAGPS